jgi:cathepsin F
MWKQEYGRNYDEEEESQRRSVFDENMLRAAELQRLNPEAEFGSTKFSDWTEDEWSAWLNSNSNPLNSTIPEFDLGQLPAQVEDSKDWTDVATTPVKDQGMCGSCWAFSATEQIESDLLLQHGVREILAPQQLVNCRKNGLPFRFGCTGGNTDKAYKVIESMGGMDREADYKYHGWFTLQTCKYKADKAAAKVTSWEYVGKGDEAAIKQYVGSTGPLSVCVAAGTWHSYKSGILTSCDNNVDHCVQLVGYGKEGSTEYWKVRNSWNTNFGEAGYIRIKMGSNLCKINSGPTKVTAEPLGGVAV